MNPSRSFKDGVDDLLSCIKFNQAFDIKNDSFELGEYCEALSRDVWTPYLEEIVQTRFRASRRISFRDSNKTFS